MSRYFHIAYTDKLVHTSIQILSLSS